MKPNNIIKEFLDLKTPYLDSKCLKNLFRNYSSPLHKINKLVESSDLIPLKQGFYLLGVKYNKEYSKLALSQFIYGPSAISFESALAYYNLIPERVEVTKSICFKRKKIFNTPVGLFSYEYIKKEKYFIGLNFIKKDLGCFFIASPQKALCDIFYNLKIKSVKDAINYLLHNLRIEESDIKNLRINGLLKLNKLYNKSSVNYLSQAIIKIKEGKY